MRRYRRKSATDGCSPSGPLPAMAPRVEAGGRASAADPPGRWRPRASAGQRAPRLGARLSPAHLRHLPSAPRARGGRALAAWPRGKPGRGPDPRPPRAARPTARVSCPEPQVPDSARPASGLRPPLRPAGAAAGTRGPARSRARDRPAPHVAGRGRGEDRRRRVPARPPAAAPACAPEPRLGSRPRPGTAAPASSSGPGRLPAPGPGLAERPGGPAPRAPPRAASGRGRKGGRDRGAAGAPWRPGGGAARSRLSRPRGPAPPAGVLLLRPVSRPLRGAPRPSGPCAQRQLLNVPSRAAGARCPRCGRVNGRCDRAGVCGGGWVRRGGVATLWWEGWETHLPGASRGLGGHRRGRMEAQVSRWPPRSGCGCSLVRPVPFVLRRFRPCSGAVRVGEGQG